MDKKDDHFEEKKTFNSNPLSKYFVTNQPVQFIDLPIMYDECDDTVWFLKSNFRATERIIRTIIHKRTK